MDDNKINIYEFFRDEIVEQIGSWEEEDFQNSNISKKEFMNPTSDTILKLILYRTYSLDVIPHCKKRVKEKIDN